MPHKITMCRNGSVKVNGQVAGHVTRTPLGYELRLAGYPMRETLYKSELRGMVATTLAGASTAKRT